MALDLNVPSEEAEEEDDPLGGLAHGHDLLPRAGAHPWEMDMEHLPLTSTWQHTNQVREFVGQKHTVFMHAYTWFVLVMGFT